MKDQAELAKEKFLKEVKNLGFPVNMMGGEAYEKRMNGKDENSWLFQPEKEQEKPVKKDCFTGYPYLVIRITGSFFHINLLSSIQNNTEDLYRLAQAQADANKLQVCLVIDEKSGVYFSSTGKPDFTDQIPKWGMLITDRLRLSADQVADADFLQRRKQLETFLQDTKSSGYLMGDRNKGGRMATQEELTRLQGAQENGLPKGLVICPVCGDYRGECLDPNPTQRGLVVKVSCYCENDNLCAYCGGTLDDRKLNSNRYEPKDGKIWHRPGFSCVNHRCSEASKMV